MKDKIKIVDQKKFDDCSVYFCFKNFDDAHVVLINLFFKLGISEKDTNQIDIIFDHGEDFYHFYNDLYMINIFITGEHICIFIKPKNQMYKNELIRVLREDFEY